MSSSTPVENNARVTVTQVAIMLKTRYHKARDLMLQGAFGEVEQKGRHLTVTRSAVESYIKKREK